MPCSLRKQGFRGQGGMGERGRGGGLDSLIFCAAGEWKEGASKATGQSKHGSNSKKKPGRLEGEATITSKGLGVADAQCP